MTWTQAISLKKLQRLGRYVIKTPQHSVVIVIHPQHPEQVFAFDNACPHRGFPMEDAEVNWEQKRLRCLFHSWEFDLGNGHCTHAGADIQVYDTEIREGKVWIKVLEAC